MDRLLGLFGVLGCGLMAYLVLRYPRWLAWRARGGGGFRMSLPSQQQLDQIETADIIVVRICGGALVLFAVGFGVAAIHG